MSPSPRIHYPPRAVLVRILTVLTATSLDAVALPSIEARISGTKAVRRHEPHAGSGSNEWLFSFDEEPADCPLPSIKPRVRVWGAPTRAGQRRRCGLLYRRATAGTAASTVLGGLCALLGEMEVLLQNGNHLGGVALHIGILPVRRFAFEGDDRLPVGRNLVLGELAIEAVAL